MRFFGSDMGVTLLRWLTQNRIGRAVGVVIGLGLIALTLMDLRIIGFVLLPLGMLVIIFGNPAKWSLFNGKAVEPDPRLLQQVSGKAFAYTICLKTHTLLDDTSATLHKACRPAVHHMEVNDDDDLILALASLEPRS